MSTPLPGSSNNLPLPSISGGNECRAYMTSSGGTSFQTILGAIEVGYGDCVCCGIKHLLVFSALCEQIGKCKTPVPKYSVDWANRVILNVVALLCQPSRQPFCQWRRHGRLYFTRGEKSNLHAPVLTPANEFQSSSRAPAAIRCSANHRPVRPARAFLASHSAPPRPVRPVGRG